MTSGCRLDALEMLNNELEGSVEVIELDLIISSMEKCVIA